MLCEVSGRIRRANMPADLFRIVIVCYFVVSFVSFSIGITTSDVRKQILSHYKKSESPGFETNPADVGILLFLTRILEMDESASTLTMEANIFINWFDFRLKWEDDVTYGNISYTTINADDIWRPNLNAFNSGRGEHYNAEMPLIVLQNGKVWWTRNGVFHSVCVQDDLRRYPLDTHVCKIRMGSLYPQDIYSRTFLKRNKTFHGVDQDPMIENQHWDLLSLEHSEGVLSVALVMVYPTDDFTFVVRRQGWLLLACIIPLMVCFILLSWTSFALPAHGKLLSKRLTVSTTCLFYSSVFLLMLIKTVPGVGKNPPIIVKVYASIVFLEFFTCLHNVFMVKILQRSSSHLGVLRKLPKQIQQILGLHGPKESGGEKGLLANEESPQDNVPEELQIESLSEDSSNLVGIAYDRVHFLLQVAAILILAFIYLA